MRLRFAQVSGLLGLSALLGLLIGCGAGLPDQAARAQRDAQYAAAERAYGNGDLAAAHALFSQVEADAVDPDARALARYRLASIAAKRGDMQAATAGFSKVLKSPSRERSALAAFALAHRALNEGDHGPMRALAETRPNTVAADKAVRALAERTTDPRATVAWLEHVAATYPDAAVADNALWWAAHLRLNALGDVAGARRLLGQIATTWSDGAIADDALWALAQLYRRQGQWAEAIKTYDALARIQPGKSFLVGSYRSRRLDDALLARGHVYFHGLQDCNKAADAYRAVLDAFESSVLRDDALFGLIQAQRCAGVSPSKTIAQLREAHPDSKFIARLDVPVKPDPVSLDPRALAR